MEEEIENDSSLAYAEINQILNLLDDKYVNKIPIKVREFFETEKNKEYKPNISIDKPLYEQNIQRETISLLTLLQISYWCESQEEKEEILKELAENDVIKEKELREKYNTDNIFKKKENNIEDIQKEAKSLIAYKEPNIIRKILDKIKKLFKR